MISTKTKYVRTGGWRGYAQPIFAIAGANDTGLWEDSPCPSHVATAELLKVKKALTKAGIKYKNKLCQTSNLFCIHRYIVVEESNLAQARAIAKEQIPGTRLLYVVED